MPRHLTRSHESIQKGTSTVPVKAKGLVYTLNAPTYLAVSRMNGTKVRFVEPGNMRLYSRGIEYAPFAYVDLNLSSDGQRQTMLVRQEWLQ